MTRNKPATKIDMEALAKDLEENTDSFLHERAEKFSVSLGCGQPWSDWRSHTKKSLRHPKANKQVRAEFEAKIKRYESEGKSIFYTDESGFTHVKKLTVLSFLPPYSPDLNPIEHKWAQLKFIRRKKKCSIDEIFTT